MSELKERQQAIQSKLQAYNSHAGIGFLAKILQTTHDFIESQTEDFEEIKTSQSPDDLSKSPLSLGKLGQKHSEIATALSVLASFRDEVARQEGSLEKELAHIAHELSTLQNQNNKEPYHLHAILVHEGTTENGHYIAFVLDRKQR